MGDEAVQLGLRRQLGVGFPARLTAADGGKVFVLIIPEDASVSVREDVLCFSQGIQMNSYPQGYLPAYEPPVGASSYADGMLVVESGFANQDAPHFGELYSTETEDCTLFEQPWTEGIPQMAAEVSAEGEMQTQVGWVDGVAKVSQAV